MVVSGEQERELGAKPGCISIHGDARLREFLAARRSWRRLAARSAASTSLARIFSWVPSGFVIVALPLRVARTHARGTGFFSTWQKGKSPHSLVATEMVYMMALALGFGRAYDASVP